MADNILSKLSFDISASFDDESIASLVRKSLDNFESIYSYLIRAKYEEERLLQWKVDYVISQNSSYNTLDTNEVRKEVYNKIINSRKLKKVIVGYRQPDIELMLSLYEPLIHKLSCEQSRKWQELEFEDAVSICQLVMVKLYREGYYLHKNLLKRSFENQILMDLRHNKYKPEVLSLDGCIYDDGLNDALTLADMIADDSIEEQREEQEEREIFDITFKEVKKIIVNLLGERQFDRLLRDYGNKHTTSWSQVTMKRLKEKLKKKGISLEQLRRY